MPEKKEMTFIIFSPQILELAAIGHCISSDQCASALINVNPY